MTIISTTSTQYIWNPAAHETAEVDLNDLTALIYAQLLELYIFDLEVEILSEKLKNIPYQPPVQPVPRTPYPWDQPSIPWPNTQPFYYGPPYKVTSSVADDRLIYSEKYDAYYNADKNVWTEDKCSDETCHYCTSRPDRPLGDCKS
jgi:hypothetical protein